VSTSEFGTRVYVVGEVLISVISLVGALMVLFYSSDQGVKLAASGILSAVTVFWFQRRQSEQSNNSLATLANGKLTQLLNSQQQLQSRTDGLVTLMAHMAAVSEGHSSEGPAQAEPAAAGV